MRWSTAASCGLAGLAFGASQARADYRDFGTQCFVGAFRACASASVSLIHVANAYGTGQPGTMVVVRLSNLQGTSRFRDSGSRSLGSFWLRNLATDVQPPGGGVAYSPFPLEGNAHGAQGVTFEWLPGNGIFFWPDNGVGNPLYGCDQPAFASEDLHAAEGPTWTCGGSVTYVALFARSTLRFRQDTRLEFAWNAYDASDNWIGEGSCVTGESCLSVVPEPVSMVLLGSGLMGLGGFNVTRRRRKPDEGVTS